jgi:6-pyruvoyltetrahydropterin/6-carboxytetrahydropterin synthase
MPSETYTVRVSKDYLVFCAGHFITYDGDHCERLHGHNYRVAVEVDGDLDANHYVFDFIALKQHTKEITDTLDHRMLLPSESDLIRVEEREGSVHVRYGDRRWTFPREDCVLLPITNTTAELLARYIGQKLLDILRNEKQFEPRALRVEVEESFGQVATYRWDRA